MRRPKPVANRIQLPGPVYSDKGKDMKRLVYILIALGLLATIYTFIYKRGNLSGRPTEVVSSEGEKVYAIFYPDSTGGRFFPAEIGHFTMRWGRTGSLPSSEEFDSALNSGKPLLLTLETWEPHIYHRNDHGTLSEIFRGSRDNELKELCEQVLSRNPQVMLRWAPEMEVPADRFPWQNRPFEYIRAFRHIDSLIHLFSPETQMVWGPSGYPGVLEFWPGSAHAEFSSVTLSSVSDAKSDAYPPYESLEEELFRKLHRLRFINTPVILLGRQQPDPDDLKKVLERRNNFREFYSGLSNDPITNSEQRSEVKIGLYDPESLLSNHPMVDIQHIFTDFEKIADGRFSKELDKASVSGQDVIVTMEPMFPLSETKDRKVLTKIINGTYDSAFHQMFEDLQRFEGSIYLRFAHEMEIPIERYPWQSQNPAIYIQAFRHFMEMAHTALPNVIRIWGPAGDRGSLEWWPGENYVDMISIAIYGLPDKNITDPEKQESFETIYNRKFRRMRFVNKPVFITEFGVKGPEGYQDIWLENAAKIIRSHPEIYGINYFNMVDTPEVWGEGIKPPDWSITEASFLRFVNKMNE